MTGVLCSSPTPAQVTQGALWGKWLVSIVTAPVPNVTAVSPTNGSTLGGTSVTITGTNLTGATAVKFGTTSATSYTVINDSDITATSPAHTAGGVDVTVTTPGGTSAATAADSYTYVKATPTVSAWPTATP